MTKDECILKLVDGLDLMGEFNNLREVVQKIKRERVSDFCVTMSALNNFEEEIRRRIWQARTELFITSLADQALYTVLVREYEKKDWYGVVYEHFTFIKNKEGRAGLDRYLLIYGLKVKMPVCWQSKKKQYLKLLKSTGES